MNKIYDNMHLSINNILNNMEEMFNKYENLKDEIREYEKMKKNSYTIYEKIFCDEVITVLLQRNIQYRFENVKVVIIEYNPLVDYPFRTIINADNNELIEEINSKHLPEIIKNCDLFAERNSILFNGYSTVRIGDGKEKRTYAGISKITSYTSKDGTSLRMHTTDNKPFTISGKDLSIEILESGYCHLSEHKIFVKYANGEKESFLNVYAVRQIGEGDCFTLELIIDENGKDIHKLLLYVKEWEEFNI